MGKDLSKEAYRIYKWIDPVMGKECRHQIDEPVALFVGKTTHRVLDTNGLVHFVPRIAYFGCVLLTYNKDQTGPFTS